jgi:hypothetical protein
MDRCWTRDPLARPSMTEIVHLFELIMTPFLSPSQQHPQLFDFSQLRYNYLNMLQSNSANVPQEIPVDQQDAIWVLTDTPQGEPSQLSRWAVLMRTRDHSCARSHYLAPATDFAVPCFSHSIAVGRRATDA